MYTDYIVNLTQGKEGSYLHLTKSHQEEGRGPNSFKKHLKYLMDVTLP